ncbi:MAG: porin [Arenicellales bacterium]
MQKKLIAAAVAGALATPVAIADVAVSGSIRTGVEYTGSEWVVADNFSRLRFKASSDLGNGQSAYMGYEFRVNSAQGSLVTGNTQRLSYVGIKGDWGSLSLGSQWSTLFNTVGTFVDKSNRYGGLGYWGEGGGQYRMKDSVALMTNLGGFSISADAQMNAGGDDLDRATIGTNLNIGGVSIGAAWQDNGNSDFTGIGASISLAGVALSGGYSDVSGSGSGYGINAKIAGIMVAYESTDSVADANIWGNYAIGLGGGAKAIIELMNDGTDTKGIGMLRMDF